MEKATKKLYKIVDTVKDVVQQQLSKIAAGEDVSLDIATELKRRFFIAINSFKTYKIEKGNKFRRQRRKLVTDLTHNILQSGEWEHAEFKEINFSAKGTPPNSGCLHPLLKVRAEFRDVLLGMGFSEMPTNNFVESSFWNFDALFQPQQHPARDAHDTFFLRDPTNCNFVADEEYVAKVKKVHEEGGYDSIGYRYNWDLKEAKKNLLRTHTTAVSARVLYQIAQEPFKPRRYFSIDRVFRNETLDQTHLAEFHQVEGFVADYNLTLGDLIGTFQSFFTQIGLPEVKFKPAYNPYTEPSMEIFAWLPSQSRWVEVGNSGIFRPEMLRPMNLPEGIRVIAWGLSLERPTMIKYGYKTIRDLFGHKVKLDLIAQNPIARFG